jgi:transketolase
MDGKKEMRAVYCQTLIDLARKNDKIMILEADLMKASGTVPFKELFPQRTVDVGVAEANMIGVAAGLSNVGKIPFPATFACFASRRVFDQFFISANYAGLNVKLTGTDPGISAAFNGGTHMPFEDVGLMRMIPGLTIYEPCDPVELKALLIQSAEHDGCTYLRLHRKGSNTIYSETEKFELGKGKILKDGNDLTIVASGYILIPEALKAAELLQKDGISAAVIDMHTIKPLDESLMLSYAIKTGHIITAENHQVAGGLGAAIANYLSTVHPTPMYMVGIHDEFGQVGTMDYLQQYYKLTADEITKQAKKLLKN